LTSADDIEDVQFAEMPAARADHARLEAQEKRAATVVRQKAEGLNGARCSC
jgi:hypothetical protein